MKDNTIYFNSDKYFNDCDSYEMYEDMGYDVQPVDVFGGLVPQDKSLKNIKINQTAVRKRFQLGEE